MHHYFEIMAGLNYRVIRNLHVCVCFKHIKLVKRLLGSFHYTHFFSKNLVYLAYSNFSNKFYILLNILESPIASIN